MDESLLKLVFNFKMSNLYVKNINMFFILGEFTVSYNKSNLFPLTAHLERMQVIVRDSEYHSDLIQQEQQQQFIHPIKIH